MMRYTMATATGILQPRLPTLPTKQSTPAGSRPSWDGRRNILYFTNWGIYRANFQPQNIPASEITHVLYSFLDIAQDGTVKSIDTWADTDKHYPGDSWNEAGNNVYGCVKQLYILKKKYRNMKVLMSLGGWTLSPHFVQPASTLAGRRKIAASAVKLLGDWGFDGIDVDWEYPQNAQQAQNYVDLLKEIRLALDKFSRDNKLNYRFLLTVATAAGPANYNIMKLKAMDQYLDGWHLMAYDYAGGWDTTTGHQANVYLSSSNPLSTKFSTDRAINDYVRAGVAPQKILMGIPLYGRSFANTAGLGQTYNGLGGGSNENGIYLFKDLPRPGAKAAIDKNLMTIITYDKQKRELVTTDSADSARLKAAYITRRGLGGAFYWEASGDKLGAKSVVSAVKKSMGPLEVSQNLLRYPTSVYDNIRRGMP
ncbi:glycoside hydrolase superfamily [Fusarium solani]|uniref:chitinase n=1 Tax=Fusarium solani TaxID=169388 RepID=A0A9P9RCW6_FUSSL|nr:glycoside hydrolase superfamily [Fusarium solani]KAH7274372.1 glycoside hydrolase superfamily [Fusarium solani]